MGGAYPGRNSEGLNPEWPADPFHVLIATILSQRTRDDNTRKASDNLFHAYDSIDAIADADPEVVAGLIRPAGFPRQKADAIVRCCRILRDEYGGKVPSSTEELVSLPMVGRKTAACVRSYAMGIPSVCVDTHVHRIANLMGLVHTKDPEATERALMEITPEDRWSDINRYMVRHGQVVCLPNHPHCERCAVRDYCDYYRRIVRGRRRCRLVFSLGTFSEFCFRTLLPEDFHGFLLVPGRYADMMPCAAVVPYADGVAGCAVHARGPSALGILNLPDTVVVYRGLGSRKRIEDRELLLVE